MSCPQPILITLGFKGFADTPASRLYVISGSISHVIISMLVGKKADTVYRETRTRISVNKE